jgi:hypothetical protein
MIIYLVAADEYEDRYICAAFTSKQAAEKFAEEMNAERNAKEKCKDSGWYRLGEEVELDERL